MQPQLQSHFDIKDIYISKCLAQSRRKVWKLGEGASSAGIICPPEWNTINCSAKIWRSGKIAPPPVQTGPVAQWEINLILMNKDISTVLFCNFNWFLFSFLCVSSFFFAPCIVNFYFITYLILEWIQYSYQRMFLVCACWSFKNANAKEQSCDFRWHL